MFMYRNFKVCIIATGQPPESPFSNGDLRKSPLIKGARGLFSPAFALYLKSCCHRLPNLMFRNFKVYCRGRFETCPYVWLGFPLRTLRLCGELYLTGFFLWVYLAHDKV